MDNVNRGGLIVLGIDPGSTRAGYGVVVFKHNTPQYINAGILATRHQNKNQILLDIDKSFRVLLKNTSPAIVGIEKIFFVKNIKTAVEVAQARGVIVLSCARAKLPIYEFSPKEIKQVVTGDGSADKKTVERVVRATLSIPNIHQPDDAYDALAIALTAGYSHIAATKKEDWQDKIDEYSGTIKSKCA